MYMIPLEFLDCLMAILAGGMAAALIYGVLVTLERASFAGHRAVDAKSGRHRATWVVWIGGAAVALVALLTGNANVSGYDDEFRQSCDAGKSKRP